MTKLCDFNQDQHSRRCLLMALKRAKFVRDEMRMQT